MTGLGLALLVGVPLLVLLVVLEGRRQARIYGRPSARPNLAGVGMLELQKHLQADRRVDALVEQVRDGAGETRQDLASVPDGDGTQVVDPEPGTAPRPLPRGVPADATRQPRTKTQPVPVASLK